MPFAWVVRRIENGGHVMYGEFTFLLGNTLVVQDFVNAFGDPARIEDIQVMKPGVVTIVESHT